MKKLIRILVVEDSEDDALLVLQQIRKGGYEIEYELVDTASKMKNALRKKPWNIVLSDYTMPNFNGLEALELLKKSQIDIPFVVISGIIGEEIAVEAMKAGAQDYIMKDNLHRLLPVVERELRESGKRVEKKMLEQKQKRTEEALYASEERFRSLCENAKIGLYRTTPEGTIVLANKALVTMLGYQSFDELTKRNLEQDGFETPLQRKTFLEEIEQIGDVENFETTWIRQDRTPVFVRESARAIRDSSGKTMYYDGTVENITLRKRAEEALMISQKQLCESEAQYRQLFETSADGILIADVETRKFKYANPALCKMLRYTTEEIIMLGLTDIHPKQNLKRVVAEFESLARGDKTLAPDIPCLRKDGSIAYADINSSNITIDGRKCMVGIFRDITERKRIEEKLRHSEQQFRLVWEKSADGMRLINEQGTVQMVNEAYCRFVEKEQSELLGKSFAVIYGQEQQEGFVRKHQERFKSRMVETHYERELILWNGRRVWIEVTSSFLELEEQPTMLLSVFRDITKRKQIEESLRQSEIKLQVIIESTADGILAIDSKGKVIKTNNRFAELWKIPPAILNSGDDATLLNFVLEQLVNPKQFLDKVQKLYNSSDEDSDTLFFKDGRIFERYSAPLILDDKIIGRVWSFRDITERKRAEDALRESEEKYRLLAETSPEMVYLIDTKGYITYVNKVAATQFRATAQEIVGKHLKDVFSPDLAQQNLAGIQKVIATKSNSQREVEMVFPTGNRWVDARLTPIFNEKNHVTGVLGLSYDITERKQAEEALLASERRYRRLIETVNEGILVAQNGFLKFVNPMMQVITGFTHEELMTLPFIDYVYPEDREILISNQQKRLNGEQFVPRYQFRIVKKDGSTRRIEMNGIIIEWEGQPATLNMLTDITERKQAEEALINSENQAHALLNAIPDLMFRLDSQGIFLDYKAAKEDLAYQTESIIGLKLRNTLPPELAGLIEEKIRCALQNGQMQEFEYQLELPLKGFCEFDARMVPSSPDEVIVIVRDVTERKKAEAEIKQINEQLLKLNAEKDKFFSIIAHDLRGPFSGFLGLTELMAEELPRLTMDEIQEISINLRNSATNLFRLLENLLHWAKLQRGKVPFEPEVIRLLPIVDESITILLDNAKSKGIEITYDIPDNLEIFADSNILQTIIRNLVSNAVKFTHKGGKISVSAKASENKSIEISVKDSGIGMSREMVDNIFRLDAKTSRKGTEDEPSTGLGLLLCKEFVEKHGGEIWVESEEGKGTTFYFTIA